MPHSWTVSEQLRWVAARRPAATAIVDDAGEMTFADFTRRVHALAGHLAPLAGERVGLYMGNRREWAEAFFACQLAGIGVVPINDRDQELEVQHLVEDAGIRLVVSDGAAHRGDTLAALRAGVDTLMVGESYDKALAAAGPARTAVQRRVGGALHLRHDGAGEGCPPDPGQPGPRDVPRAVDAARADRRRHGPDRHPARAPRRSGAAARRAAHRRVHGAQLRRAPRHPGRRGGPVPRHRHRDGADDRA